MHVHRSVGLLASAVLAGVTAVPAVAASAAVPSGADLVLTASHAPGTVVAGTSTTFRLDVHNAGPDDVTGALHVTDTLPAGTTYATASAPWTCLPSPDSPSVVDCTLSAGLAAGQDAPHLDLEVKVGAGVAAGTITDSATATAGAGTTDPTPDDATDTVDVEVVQRADLSVTATTGTARVGQSVDQVLTVHSDGPSLARGVVLETVLPTGLRYRSATGDGWQCTGVTDVTCTHADPLGVDDDATVTLSTDVLATAYPAVTTSATVHGSTTDPTPGNDTATDEVDVPALAGLSVRTGHVGSLAVGAVTHYLVRVTNRGPTAAEGPIVVTDEIPAGLSFVSATAPGWDCTRVGATLSCEHAGPLATRATSDLVLDLRVLAAAYPSVSNTVTVSGPSTDPTSTDNTATDVAAVTRVVQLGIDKAVTHLSGLQATYTLTASNRGTIATVGPTRVVDDLPAGLRFVSASGPGWTCSTAGQKVTCVDADPLAPGASAAITLVTQAVPRVGTVVNTATVSGTSATSARDRATIEVYRIARLVSSRSTGASTGASTAAASGTGSTTTAGHLQPGSVYTSADDGSTGSLPETGGPSSVLPLTALVALAGGGALLLLDRRRSLHHGRHRA